MIYLRVNGEVVPWGWGAFSVDNAPKGWRCPECGRAARSTKTGRHHYRGGRCCCTDCARTGWQQREAT